ncbi:MAG: thioester domain-containing protein [Solirubrobacterales bacterium]|nr:thioester domain-containing protein [Solirubrobacterales bacterium]
MSGVGHGRGVTGFIANPGSDFDPVADGYPASNPTSEFTPKDEGFAGIIHGTPVGGGATLNLYCIDILTVTFAGLGYELGTWDASGVPNVGYVARLLNDYYPNTNEPSTFPDGTQMTRDEMAAAVQAAIWFFTDRYVINTSMGQFRAAVVDIVDAVIKDGPLIEPPPPSLTLTPGSVSGPRRVLGPFTVATNHPPATVTATGATMYSNAAGTTLLGDGTTAMVPDGQHIWLRSTGPSTAALQATSTATVPSGNVYLYDGNADVNDAQRLILARTTELKTTVYATAEFLPFGKLVVKKTIAGPAAGSQGRVVIRARCDDGVRRPNFIIPAGTHAGTSSRTYRHIAAGTTCTVTETSNGSTTTTEVVVRGDGQEVTIPKGRTKTVKLKDIYRFVPGSLLVRKTIAGPGAGQQGEITIHTVCNGTALAPDFAIAAGAPAGEHTKQYDRIRVPAKCTVTETADGHTSAVSVVVEGSGQTVSIPPGDVAEADISDTYALVPGQLEVTKTIAGPAAGSQGEVVIHTLCNGAVLTPDFVIPAGATGDQSHIYSGIATPASCVVTETADGATSAVSVVVTGSPQTTTISPGGAGAAHITDTYGAMPGSLLVTKTIAGPLAGHQGPVTIHVVCNGTALSPDFVIASGTSAGSVSHSFDGIPAGSVCTVTETTDGSNDAATATVSGDDQAVTIPAGRVVSVSLSDVYEGRTGSLKVTKTITGPAAGQHGRIAILVACGGSLNDFTFLIGARTGPGSVSRHFDNIPAGSRCTVTELVDGHTHNVAVVATGRHTTVTIGANTSATAHITDSFIPHRVPVTG